MLTGAVAVQRVRERLGFGPSRTELSSGQSTPPGDVAAALLAQRPAADDPMVDLGPHPGAVIVDGKAVPAAVQQINQQQGLLTDWWLDRMVTTDRPYVEKLTWFWHGHFATAASTVANPNLMEVQNRTLRQVGGGSFVELAGRMVVDPAMLIWLNGVQNQALAPNENLARELMELFTLGVGNYTETDVREAARALTGWAVDQVAFVARLVPQYFDAGPKTVLGATVGDAGSLVSMLTGRPESAEFLANRVWRRFVSTTPPSPDVVRRLAAALGPQRDIAALMAAIVVEPAFLDPTSTLVKQPVEWAVGLMRALGVRPALLDAQSRTSLQFWLQSMGQLPFEPPDVGGWPAGDRWLTTGSALNRWWIAGLVAGHADLTPLTATPPAVWPEVLASMLGVGDWSPRTVEAMRTVSGDSLATAALAACAPEYVVSR